MDASDDRCTGTDIAAADQARKKGPAAGGTVHYVLLHCVRKTTGIVLA
jgi:hypothetical protein